MSNQKIIIRGGKVIDPANNTNSVFDVIIEDGRIARLEETETSPDEEFDLVVDAKGFLVTPGLIDCHTHVYEHATTLGVNPDKTCLAKGVTTVVDGGSSGAMTFEGLKKFICEPSKTRVLAFLHIACHGLAGAGCSGPDFGAGGESDHLNAIKVELCAKTVKENPDIIVGIKVRLDVNITDEGRTEKELYDRAIKAATLANVPLLVHHTNSTIPLGPTDEHPLASPGSMRPGDIYTHTFHGHGSSIMDRESMNIYESVLDAKRKGVLFDVGHGQGSFDWEVGESAAKIGFWPDLISTDLHSGNVDGAVRDLTNVASKFRFLGMSVYEIISAMTFAPAKAIRREDSLGSLGVGREADVTILKVVATEEPSIDSFGNVRIIREKFVSVGVLRSGVYFHLEN